VAISSDDVTPPLIVGVIISSADVAPPPNSGRGYKLS